MANEIKVAARLEVVNGDVNEPDNDTTFSTDQTTLSGGTPGYVTIGTSEETYTFPEITVNLGWCKIKNLDTTNFLKWGFSTGVYGGKIPPQESIVFKFMPGSSLFIIADIAACKAIIRAYED